MTLQGKLLEDQLLNVYCMVYYNKLLRDWNECVMNAECSEQIDVNQAFAYIIDVYIKNKLYGAA